MRSKPIQKGALAALAITSIAVLFAAETPTAMARPSRNAHSYGEFNPSSVPVLAIVGLAEQRVSIYDATGKILEAPVSSGATGYETPAGIYSIVQKEEEHHSNLYDDASMPFMERITWTGIALHAGVLPGYPASHGCVRMPLDFAKQLYQITKPGMRVVVMREAIAPVSVPQPALFTPSADSKDAILPAPNLLRKLESIKDAKTSEADAAKRRDKEARANTSKKNAEAATRALRNAEANLAKAEADLKAFDAAPSSVTPPVPNANNDAAKAKAAAKVEAAQAQLQTAKSQAQAASDNARSADEDARSATAALSVAMDAAEEASQNLSPVSVLISRKTQRLYIRKGNKPVFEAPVMIRDADKPIGTFIFTALDHAGASGGMHWNVVSMYKAPTNIEPFVKVKQTPSSKVRREEPPVADASAAQAALDRLTVPQEAADKISKVVLPGSSLIVSDEGPSIETGKDTDFVLFMSGEPQGGIAIRQHNTASRRDRGEYDEDGYRRIYSRGRARSGGYPFFFSDD